MKKILLLLMVLFMPTLAHAAPKKVLFISTSHAELRGTGEKTGLWLEELTTPYYILKDAGYDITIASIRGGKPPIDPKSDDASVASNARFKADEAAIKKLANTTPIRAVKPEAFDAVFLPGGHGTVWDFAGNTPLNELLQHFVVNDKPIAAVCHGPVALLELMAKDSKTAFLKGRKATGFTKAEEVAIKLENVVPFYLDVSMKEKGAEVITKPNFQANTVVDGLLITGQNPASSEGVAKALVKLLK